MLATPWLNSGTTVSLIKWSACPPRMSRCAENAADATTTTPQEVTQAAHRRLINIFRDRRPGPHGWDAVLCDDRLSRYVIKYAEDHVRASWMDDWKEDVGICWLEDFKVSQDAVPLAVARFLGTERVSELAQQAEAEGDWWSASLRWSATALVNRVSSGMAASQPLFKMCAVALDSVQPTSPQATDAKQRLEVSTLIMIMLGW